MRGKTGLALGLAIGYVFGTKAGRERYEQLSQSAKRLADDPSLRRSVLVDAYVYAFSITLAASSSRAALSSGA